ncbi:hypothetical protein CPB84DRAFT_1848602 [Gymnopilus junonius]|uniref:Uncharacterized protein n=1 Tax=Gymnopilus junonius TaxID=109634 RepID=A0A9P5NKN5_GYMJU|nr:hypothetical protein CPB84DRAFT_1848602 [Gymnopilus junonius]
MPVRLFIPNTAPKNIELFGLPLDVLSVQWRNTTCVSAGASYNVNDCIEILRRGKHLTECSIAPMTGRFTAFPLDMCMNSHITRLKIVSYCGQEDMAFFFDHVTCPALHTLYLDSSLDNVQMRSLKSFLQRSSCELQVLGLSGARKTSGEFIELAMSLHTLSELELDAPDFGMIPGMLQSFYRSFFDHDSFLPCLQRLSLVGNFDFPEQLILALVAHFKVDKSTYRPLESVVIVCQQEGPIPYISQSTLDQIRFLQQKNMKFKIEHLSGNRLNDLLQVSLEKINSEERT